MTDDRPRFELGPIHDIDPDDAPEVVFFPVRHYSPISARLLWDLARAIRPTALLVEGPADFNDRIDELMLDGHELPIALYSYVRLSDDTKRSAFYPYCEYAPEWQANRVAAELDVPLRFIDLPWSKIALETDRQHRYSDHHFRKNPYPEALCERMNVGDFDELWDVMFELDEDLDWREYMRRCHEFCWHLRIFGGGESDENIAREEYMTQNIRQAADEFGGPLLVVTGGYHSSGLYARLHGLELEYLELADTHRVPDEVDDEPAPGALPDDLDLDDLPDNVRLVNADPEPEEPPEVVDAGITLTPFTYERIDKLSGYASGVHGPAFYQYVWEQRREGEPLDCQPFLYDIVQRLRDRGQVASTADVIGIESTARALATLRGRTEIWRFDLLDAISSAIVKEAQDAEYMHPVLQLAREVLRGDRRGAVDEEAPLPPLVTNARRRLEELDLLPEDDDERRLTLDLDDDEDRDRSRVLHQCRVLGIAGFEFSGGTDFATREDLSRVWEEWVLGWTPEFEATLIESAVYGSDLDDASTARVLERARQIEADAEKAALIAIDAVLMGVTAVAESVYEKLEAIVREDGDFFNVATALGHLLYLYRHDEVLGSKGDPQLAQLLRETYLRTLWLFESLGTVKDRDAELLDGIKSVFNTFRRCYLEDSADREEFTDVFARCGNDDDQLPLTRGAAMGVLYSLDELNTDRVLAVMRYFADPMDLGDFLIGFFSLAREAAQRDPRLLQLVDDMVCDLSEQQFLEVLPALRLAFTFFTPREKHTLVDMLFGDRDEDDTPIDARSAAEGASLERRIRDAVMTYGLRGIRGELPEPPEVEDRPTRETEGEGESGPEEAAPDEPGSGQEETANGHGERETGQEGTDAGDGAQGTGQDGAGTGSGEEGSGRWQGVGDRKERWRMILGAGSEGGLGGLSGEAGKRDRLLAYLYDREYGPGRNVRGGGAADRGRRGSLDPSQLTVPEWINGVHELFPQRTIERMEKDALDRYEIEEIVTRPDVLSRAQPNPTLLKAVLRTKHLMDREVLDIARRMVRRVVQDLMEKLARDIQQPFTGALNRRRRSFLKVAKNFDALETIRRNLKHWNSDRGQIVIREPVFYSRIRRHVDRWQVIIVVDQSGSMLDSVIHAAVTASIFHGIRALKSHLVAFDTEIVDLTEHAGDAVETLMGVQLGGGTDIANALEYAYSLVETPSRTIVVLVTDFFEGGPLSHLLGATKQLTESGVHLLGLAALDEQANPYYDRETAAQMARLGAHVGAMTPGELAEWVAEKVR